MKKKFYPRWDRAKRMPRLRHSVPGEPFDIDKSEVAAWLVSQPEIRQAVFDLAKESGKIIFDSETRTWVGVDYAN